MADEEVERKPDTPVLVMEEIKAWGAEPAGSRAQLLVRTALQEVLIAVDFETLINLSLSVKAAIYQCRKNAAASGKEELVQAVPVNTYGVGHAQGVEGVLMAIDAGRPTETTYVLQGFMAIDLGRRLVGEGMRLQKRDETLSKVHAAQPKRKLILPRDVN
jgi:hypothetical protein